MVIGKCSVYHTPGHNSGSMCVLLGDYIMTGDTLFKGTIGELIFWGGDFEVMKETLKIFKELNGDIKVMLGHEGLPAKN